LREKYFTLFKSRCGPGSSFSNSSIDLLEVWLKHSNSMFEMQVKKKSMKRFSRRQKKEKKKKDITKPALALNSPKVLIYYERRITKAYLFPCKK
jgi:hypothetical protein